jgi:hypothetical protein
MHRPLVLAVLACLSLARAAPAQQDTQAVARVTVRGVVRDTLSGNPVRRAVVRAAGGGSTLTDDDGRYVLVVHSLAITLDARAIGYRPASVTFTAQGAAAQQDLWLRAFPVQLAAIVTTEADDPARRIIRAAIARKHEIFARLHDYRYEGFVKLVVRNLKRSPDSADAVLLITETRTSAYWEQPDHYQETILARRQSSNLNAERNLVSVGQIVNFNRERIEMGQYLLVSPIADDALDAYTYAILDTLNDHGRTIFRLAITPGTDAAPRFAGMIDIADSTFDVMGIDVGVNDMVRFSFIKNLRYRQRLNDMGTGHWMPEEIRFSGEVHIGGPLPALSFEHTAALGSFRFNEGNAPPTLSEYRIVVDDRADRPDSALWATTGAVPLTDTERAAWSRIDSLQRLPPSATQVMFRAFGTALFLSGNPDFFSFNRVDGAYVGAGGTGRGIPGWIFDGKLGYGFGSERWQYRAGVLARLSETQRLWVGASVHDVTQVRPTIGFRSSRSSLDALFFRVDPRDYYRGRGFIVQAGTKLVDFTRLDIQYNDERQWSLPVVTDYALLARPGVARGNPPIAEGHLRSISGSVSFDSHPFMKQGSIDYRVGSVTWDRVVLGAEIAAPSLIPNDFDFGRYVLTVERRQRTFGIGLTTLTATGATSSGTLPPQRSFGVNINVDALGVSGGRVRSLADSNLTAVRAATFTLRHDFDRLLLANSHLPLIRKLPFTVSVQGGLFWTDLAPPPLAPFDSASVPAPPQHITSATVGFRVGNLTPFLGPFNFSGVFSWRFSSYLPRRFQFGVDLSP